jgi:hypothetical protein
MHVTINRRYTDWSALSDIYLHDLYKIHHNFYTVAVIT